MLPGQMSLLQLASVKDGPRNLLLKFDYNQVRNSWYNPDMDKCHMEKCCLDKCHLRLKFCQNRFINSWDIPDMDKFHQVKCCPDKCQCDNWHLLKIVPESWFGSLVKIGSVTADILPTLSFYKLASQAQIMSIESSWLIKIKLS